MSTDVPLAVLARDALSRWRVRLRRAVEHRPGASAEMLVPHGEQGKVRVNCIVFSRDRAPQLEACVRSILRYAPYDGPIVAVVRSTTDRFRDGYRMLAPIDRLTLVEETDFRRDVLRAVDRGVDHLVFHTDDEVFFAEPPCTPFVPEGAACFSLRLGLNTTYCYPHASQQPVPEVMRVGDVIAWDWSSACLDFAYPMSVNGHVFRTAQVWPMLERVHFRNPTELERELHFLRHRMPRLMLAFSRSIVVSIPLNVVTDTITNRSGVADEYSPRALNERFLLGEVLDIESVDFSTVRGAHQEFELGFRAAR